VRVGLTRYAFAILVACGRVAATVAVRKALDALVVVGTKGLSSTAIVIVDALDATAVGRIANGLAIIVAISVGDTTGLAVVVVTKLAHATLSVDDTFSAAPIVLLTERPGGATVTVAHALDTLLRDG